MESLLILGVAVGWVALWLYIFKHAPNRAARVGAVLAAVLIPFWDLPIGYFEYHRHCATDGGLRVYESIKPQDKVYFETLPTDFPEQLLKQGFKVVEIRRFDGKGVERHEIEQGKVVFRTVMSPESVVAVSRLTPERLDWNIYREGFVAHSLRGTKALATYTTFSWHGGWLKEETDLFRGSLNCFRNKTNPLINLLRQGT